MEGQTRNIDEGFPSGSSPYTDYYDYLSDSDLEDEISPSEEEEENAEDGGRVLPRSTRDSDAAASTTTSGDPPLPSRNMSEARDNNTSALSSATSSISC